MQDVHGASKICRTCLSETENAKIIFEVTISEEQNIRITDFIRRLTSLKITKRDDLPDNICTPCIEALCKAFNFAQMCIVTDTKLKLHRKSDTHAEDSPPEVVKEDIAVPSPVEDDDDEKYCENFFTLKQDHSPSDDGDVKIKTDRQDLHKRDAEMPAQLELLDETTDPLQREETFPELCQLKTHDATRGEDGKRFSCGECGQKFTYSYLLEKHSYKHRKQKPFPCMKCNKGCVTAESLRRHMRIHDVNYEKKTHVCGVCSREFPYPSFLAEHMKNHTGEKPYLCSICGKGFRQSGTLHYHMRSHTGKRPYACEVCNNRFTSPGILKVHMRRHTDERPYVCDICGVAFRQSTDMKSHRRIHTGDKRVLCTICGKRLSSTGQLTVHIRSHTGEKPYPCRFCQKAFATRTMLVKHERIHTGERPYVCKICGKAFNQSSTLKTHANVHKIAPKSEAQDVSYCLMEEDGANTKLGTGLPTAMTMTV